MTRTITPAEVLQHLDQIAALLNEISSTYGLVMRTRPSNVPSLRNYPTATSSIMLAIHPAA